MSVIKIFSTQRIDKKDTYCIENEIFQPIRCGAVFDTGESDMPGDNTGENISHKRLSFCELTTQYWVWKNVEADYYGFGHYRRYFSFSDEPFKTDDWNVVAMSALNGESAEKLCLNDTEKIRRVVEPYDVILPPPTDLRKVGFDNVYEQFTSTKHLKEKDIHITLEIIRERYPDYYEAAAEVFNGHLLNFANLFIMKRELFFIYSEWLFDILEEFERRVDMSAYSEEGFRTPGHLGERLLCVFCCYLKKQRACKFGTLQSVVFGNTSRIEIARPVFDEAVTVIFSCTEYYLSYCAAALQSIISHANPNRNYDIIILEREINDKMKTLTKQLARGMDNVSIRFLNVSPIFKSYQLRIREHFAVETYFRLAIPDVMPDYDKILYLDGDLIVLEDIAALYDTDISGHCIAGVPDIVLAGHINGFSPEKHVPYYQDCVLIAKDNLLRQVNAGVLLLNLQRIRTQYTCEEMLRLAQLGCFHLCDQDVMNTLFQNELLHLRYEWNVAATEKGNLCAYVATFAPRGMYEKYAAALDSPKILHFLGTVKPWSEPGYENAWYFWETIRQTPFYEIILHRRTFEISQFLINQVSGKAVPPPPNEGFLRRVVNVFLPYGSKRRESLKKLLGKKA